MRRRHSGSKEKEKDHCKSDPYFRENKDYGRK